jgi:hypothetical protein
MNPTGAEPENREGYEIKNDSGSSTRAALSHGCFSFHNLDLGDVGSIGNECDAMVENVQENWNAGV